MWLVAAQTITVRIVLQHAIVCVAFMTSSSLNVTFHITLRFANADEIRHNRPWRSVRTRPRYGLRYDDQVSLFVDL